MLGLFRVSGVNHSCENYEQETAEDPMDINKILKELRSEREEIERAILALEQVGGKRRGRPPLWMKAMEMLSLLDCRRVKFN